MTLPIPFHTFPVEMQDHIGRQILAVWDGSASEEAVTSSNPAHIARIRPAVSVWPPRTLRAGTSILQAFCDKV